MTLKEKLQDWADIDWACFELAKCLGMMDEETKFSTDAKHIFWSNNLVENKLFDFLLRDLVEIGILEYDNDEQRVKWNNELKGSWEGGPLLPGNADELKERMGL